MKGKKESEEMAQIERMREGDRNKESERKRAVLSNLNQPNLSQGNY